MLARMIFIAKLIPSQTETSIDKELDQLWGCEGLKRCQYGTVSIQTSVLLRIGCLMATGIPLDWKLLAAGWVDLGDRLRRGCLHSLADVITPYQRGISKCLVMNLVFNALGSVGITLQLTDRELDPDQVLKNPTAVAFMIEWEFLGNTLQWGRVPESKSIENRLLDVNEPVSNDPHAGHSLNESSLISSLSGGKWNVTNNQPLSPYCVHISLYLCSILLLFVENSFTFNV